MQSHHVLVFSACFPVICDLWVTHVDCLYRHLLYLHSILLTVVNLTSAAQRSQNWPQGMSSVLTLLHLTPERGKVSFRENSENQLRSNTGGKQDPAQIPALQTQQVEGCMGGSVRRVLMPTPSRPPTRPGPAVHWDELHGRGSDFWASYLNLSTLLVAHLGHCLAFAGGVLIVYVLIQKFILSFSKKYMISWGAWVAQSVKRPTSAQVMISWFVGSSPRSGSVLTARSLEPPSDSVSPSLSLPLPHSCSVSLFLR